MAPTTLETDRLRLRPPTIGDLPIRHARLGSDPEVAWDGEPGTLAESEQTLRRRIEHFDRHGWGLWVVEWKDAGGFLGEAGLQHLRDSDEVEIGYYLARAAWGKGVATEAGRASLEYGFGALGLDHVVAVVRPENAGSKRVLEKLGLRFDHVGDHYGVAGVEVWRAGRPAP